MAGLDPLLEGRNAVVTGAANGIGRAAALALVQAGANVAACDRDAQHLEDAAGEARRLGRQVITAVLDVRDAEAVATFLRQAGEHLGHLDILVNNAGGGFYAPVLEVRAKGRSALVDENFTSVLHFIDGFVPLVPAGGGSIVNITSVEAFRAAPGFGIYAAMKAAVENLSKTLALELADRGIRVNSVAPDAIPTPGDAGLSIDVNQSEDFSVNIPLGMGHVDDVAAAVLYLASDMARFVTGTTIHVDGGSHAASGWRRGPDGRFRP